ncbi:hypothetical protein MGU_11754 [Metarhizium guizhouense ARSEF 977]|uniref:F-box domain-containing protein n=1 Tax=Metarhizium guizhouense (strain ARSEF 977) TaxID=1276136 RepID=A0A0B4GEA9_METGA|nr:hypothetical protein MGU_11754 [Metarhizium guizhouense ARSEF 977]
MGSPAFRRFPDPFSNPAPTPASFDYINSGQDLAESSEGSRLLNLPVEILSKVIENFDLIADKESLACLALVNRDCGQLARSCQFRSVKLDFSSRATSLAGVLFREAVERSRHKGRTRLPSLGACVRHVRVSNMYFWRQVDALKAGPFSREDNHEDDREPMTDLQLQQWRDNVSNLSQRNADIYEPSMLFAISTLPHLDILDMNELTVNQYVLDSLTGSACRHLRVKLSIEDTGIRIPALVWPLETLNLDVSWNFTTWCHSKSSNMDASFLWEILLRMCSQSLQTLRMGHQALYGKPMKPISFTLKFPRLRFLEIACDLHSSALQSLLINSLQALFVDYSIPATRNYLYGRGQIRDLSLLVWTGFEIPDDASIRMLSNNHQRITAFGTQYAQSAAFLDRVLPVLADLDHLTGLSMVWDGTEIPESSLHLLAFLVSLKHLHISAGNQSGWRRNWEISHGSLCSVLSPLERLKSLLFTRDSYARD